MQGSCASKVFRKSGRALLTNGSSTTLTIVHCIGDHHTRAAFLHSPKDALEKSFKLPNFRNAQSCEPSLHCWLNNQKAPKGSSAGIRNDVSHPRGTRGNECLENFDANANEPSYDNGCSHWPFAVRGTPQKCAQEESERNESSNIHRQIGCVGEVRTIFLPWPLKNWFVRHRVMYRNEKIRACPS